MKRQLHVDSVGVSSEHSLALAMRHHAHVGPGPHDPTLGLCLLVRRTGGPRGVLVDLRNPEVTPEGWHLSDPDIQIIPVQLELDPLRCQLQVLSRQTAQAVAKGQRKGRKGKRRQGLAVVSGGAR